MSTEIQNKSTVCSNCNQSLQLNENFCPNCGQKNTDLNISLKELAIDFFRDFFSFDSKFINTIPPLLFKPGKVPKEYIEGKRVSHVPPLRVFIFLSFISFFLWGLSFESNEEESENQDNNLINILADDSLTTNSDILDSLNAELKEVRKDEKLDTIIDGMNFTIDTASSKENNLNITEENLAYVLDKENSPTQIVDSLAPEASGFTRRAFSQALRVYQAEEGEIKSYLIGNISIVLLLFQPFFALLLKLFYVRRKDFFYIEHLVFSLYFHAFILLLVLLLFIISFLVDISLVLFILLMLVFIYLILALKRFYMQPYGKTIFKGLLISAIYLLILFPASAIGYLFLSLYFY